MYVVCNADESEDEDLPDSTTMCESEVGVTGVKINEDVLVQ